MSGPPIHPAIACGNVTVVTGAGSGIGRAAAQRLNAALAVSFG